MAIAATLCIFGCTPEQPTTNPGDQYEGDEEGECDDGADNDRDMQFDCDDPGCDGAPVCNIIPGDDDDATGDDDDSADDDDATGDDDDSADDDDATGDDDDDTTEPDPDPDTDFDGDGYTDNQGDCHDGDPNVHPNAEEVCDYKDTNCDGIDDQWVFKADCHGGPNWVVWGNCIDVSVIEIVEVPPWSCYFTPQNWPWGAAPYELCYEEFAWDPDCTEAVFEEGQIEQS